MIRKAKKRGILSWQRPEGRRLLSEDEANYWLALAQKTLKIGTEFEANLPSSSAKSLVSPVTCSFLNQGCRTDDCENIVKCITERHPAFCLTRVSNSYAGQKFLCPAKSDGDTAACADCPAWTLNCQGMECSLFTPRCVSCPSFSGAAKNSPEKLSKFYDSNTIRARLHKELTPSGFVGDVGTNGVMEVTHDGSLVHDGGVEIITVGRRAHWDSFYRMCNTIVEKLLHYNAYVNERCGQHFHILIGYLPGKDLTRGKAVSEMEVAMPEIILANFHQLCRRYELAMFWLMMAGTSENSNEHLTRWARFRQSIFRFSSLRKRMFEIQAEIGKNIIGMASASAPKGKYASIAYHNCRFNENGDVSIFHVENRIADAAHSAAAISAWAMLNYALVLKAIRLSKYGLIEVGDKNFVIRTTEAKPHLIDGETRGWGGDRLGYTANLADHMDFVQGSAIELIEFLKPELADMGPAFQILMRLAEMPIAFRRKEGQSWERIERELLEGYTTADTDPLDGEIQEVIDMVAIVDCPSLTAWITETAELINQNPQTLDERIQNKIKQGKCRWSEALGAIISS